MDLPVNSTFWVLCGSRLIESLLLPHLEPLAVSMVIRLKVLILLIRLILMTNWFLHALSVGESASTTSSSHSKLILSLSIISTIASLDWLPWHIGRILLGRASPSDEMLLNSLLMSIINRIWFRVSNSCFWNFTSYLILIIMMVNASHLHRRLHSILLLLSHLKTFIVFWVVQSVIVSLRILVLMWRMEKVVSHHSHLWNLLSRNWSKTFLFLHCRKSLRRLLGLVELMLVRSVLVSLKRKTTHTLSWVNLRREVKRLTLTWLSERELFLLILPPQLFLCILVERVYA